MRRSQISISLLLLLIMPTLAASQSISDQAKKLHSTSIVIDTHDDTTQRLLDPKFDLSLRHSDGNIEIQMEKKMAERPPSFMRGMSMLPSGWRTERSNFGSRRRWVVSS